MNSSVVKATEQVHQRQLVPVPEIANLDVSNIAVTPVRPSVLRQYLENYYNQTVANIKRLLPRCIHHFKSDLINNMDHMRISGTSIEPSSVILSQRK